MFWVGHRISGPQILRRALSSCFAAHLLPGHQPEAAEMFIPNLQLEWSQHLQDQKWDPGYLLRYNASLIPAPYWFSFSAGLTLSRVQSWSLKVSQLKTLLAAKKLERSWRKLKPSTHQRQCRSVTETLVLTQWALDRFWWSLQLSSAVRANNHGDLAILAGLPRGKPIKPAAGDLLHSDHPPSPPESIWTARGTDPRVFCKRSTCSQPSWRRQV